MWEISISVNDAKNGCINNLAAQIEPYLKRANGVMARGAAGNRSVLSLACEDAGRKTLADALRGVITEIIVTDFKYDYIFENSRLPNTNPVNYNAFLKALVAFDSEFDRDLVIKKLSLSKELMLDGFFNFRLKELRERWKEICELANDNSGYLSFPDTFLELLKFLVDTIGSRAGEVRVYARKNVLKIDDCETLEPFDGENLPALLIGLKPGKIIIYDAGVLPQNILNLICGVFEERVETL